MEIFAVRVTETKERIVLLNAENLPDAILKVQSLHNEHRIDVSSSKPKVSVSGYNALPQTIKRLQNDKNVIKLTDEEIKGEDYEHI